MKQITVPESMSDTWQI